MISNQKTVRVLGIDCGTAIVGWSIIEGFGANLKVIDYGDIRTKAGLEIGNRLAQIYEALIVLIEKYKPSHMAVEELFFFKNNKTVISVSEARGVILLAGQNKGLTLFGYTPLQVKMAVTGYGRADKKQVQIMVTKILKLKEVPKLDDTADALAICVCHFNNLKIIQ
jgi:crossover junction endodeoxyribonuclease RuvC